MSRKNPRAGEGPCPCCTRPVVFRESATKKLSYACQWCDTSGYADPGGKGHRQWLASLTDRDPGEAPPAAPPAAPKAPPPPPARAARSVFDLSNLGKP